MYKYKSLQIDQLPWKHLSFLQNLLNFIITKYLKQEVDYDLSICVDEGSPCDLSITGNIKNYHCHMINGWHYYPQWGSVISTSIMKLFLLPKFDNSRNSGFVTWLSANDITNSLHITHCPNLMFLASLQLEICADFE